MPPHLKACLDQKPLPSTSADGAVINELQVSDERAACYRAVLDWYEGVRQAHRKVAKP